MIINRDFTEKVILLVLRMLMMYWISVGMHKLFCTRSLGCCMIVYRKSIGFNELVMTSTGCL